MINIYNNSQTKLNIFLLIKVKKQGRKRPQLCIGRKLNFWLKRGKRKEKGRSEKKRKGREREKGKERGEKIEKGEVVHRKEVKGKAERDKGRENGINKN